MDKTFYKAVQGVGNVAGPAVNYVARGMESVAKDVGKVTINAGSAIFIIPQHIHSHYVTGKYRAEARDIAEANTALAEAIEVVADELGTQEPKIPPPVPQWRHQ